MGRRIAIRALIAAGAVLAVLAIVSLWVSRQALETDEWTHTSTELLEEPAVQAAVANLLVDELYANVDVAGELEAALPPRAAVLAEPAAGALRRAAVEVADQALDRPLVQQAWERANRRAHAVLVDVVEGGGPVVGTEDGAVTLDLRELLAEVGSRTGLSVGLADRLPAGAGTVEILRAEQLSTAQAVGRMLKPLAAVLTLLTLACLAGAVWLARGRRRETVRAAGLALVVAGLTTLVVRELLGGVVVDELAATATSEPVVEAVWRVGTSLLVDVAWASIAYGVLVVAGAWLAGPMRPAVRIRRTLAPYLASPWATYGAVAAIVLLVLLWGPTEGTRRVLPALVLLALLVAGVEALRRQVRAEPLEAGRETPRDGKGDTALIAQLERLDALHRDGGLGDEEFAVAKHRVLEHA